MICSIILEMLDVGFNMVVALDVDGIVLIILRVLAIKEIVIVREKEIMR
jgi:hypothetical protein